VNSKENEKEKIESKKSFLNVNLDLRRFSDERFNGLVIDFSENENYDNIIKNYDQKFDTVRRNPFFHSGSALTIKEIINNDTKIFENNKKK